MADSPTTDYGFDTTLMPPKGSDPYEGLGSPTPPPAPASTPAPADPYEGLGSPTPPATTDDPYAGLGSPVPPISDEEFQNRLKRWGPMLSGQGMATPADLTEMQASGRFTPEQLQRVQTETGLRQTYIDQQARGLWDKTKAAGSAGLSAAGNMLQDVTVAPRIYQEYQDLSANPQNPQSLGTMEGRVGTSVLEGASQAATGLLGMAKGLVTGPAGWIKNAVTPQPDAQQAEKNYQDWKLDYLSTHAVPGYAPPVTSGRVQDLVSAVTGAPTSALPALEPIAPITSAASTFATLPVFAGAGKVAEEVIPKALAATGAAKALPNLSAALSPGGAGVANASKLRDAMVKALETAPGTPEAAATGGVAATAGNAAATAGKVAQAIGAIPEKVMRWAAQKITGSPDLADKLLNSGLLTKALVGSVALTGASPVSMAIGLAKGLEGAGAVTEGLGDFVTRAATADPTSPFGRFMALAADKEAPAWMREISQSPLVQFALKSGNLASSTIKGGLKGAAAGAGIGLASGQTPEEIGENAAGMGVFGGMHGAMSAAESKIFQAHLGAVAKFVTDHINSGGSPDTLRLVPADQVLQASLWNNFNPDWKVRFATGADAGSPFSPGGKAEGQAGLYDRDAKTLWVDPTKRAPGATLTHEAFHPIFDNLVSKQGDVKDTLDSALAEDGRTIDHFKQEYASRVFPTDPYAAAEYVKAQDAANPDWAYSELLSESAAHELSGQDLLEAAKGNAVKQTATQAALGGMDDWLSAQGVKLKETSNGTIFPDYNGVFVTPEVRKLTYKLLKSQRESVLGKTQPEETGRALTPADMGTKTAPWYKTATGQNVNPYGEMVVDPKTGKEVFRQWPASELRKRVQAEAAARKKYFKPGQQVTTMPAGFEADPDISPWTKAAVKSAFDSVSAKNNLSLWYHRLNSENSATSDRSWAADVRRTLGNARVSFQNGKPLSVEMTKKGNLIVHWESEEAENQKLADWANRHGDLSLDLWSGDQAKAKADIQTYLENHATGQPGEANGIGTAKRDVINAMLAGDNKQFQDKNPLRGQLKKRDRAGIMRSLRVDRMESVTPESSERAPTDWEKLKRNMSPGEGLHAHQFSPSEAPEAVKTAAVRDNDTGKIYEGPLHFIATGKYFADKFPGEKAPRGPYNVSEGFVTNKGEFLDRNSAFERAVQFNQYKAKPSDQVKTPTHTGKGYLEAFNFNPEAARQGMRDAGVSGYSPAAEPVAAPGKREIELTGPDGKKYAAKYDGLQDDFSGGYPWIQVTPQVDLPGATGAKSTTYAHSLLKKGYTLPQDLLDEVKAHVAANPPQPMQFSPSAKPEAIKAAAVRDEDTGKIYEASNHFDAAGQYLRDKFPKGGGQDEAHNLTDGFTTNKGEFLSRKDAYARAEKFKQLTPSIINRTGLVTEDLKRKPMQFSPSDDPSAIKSAAVRDKKTGTIYPGASHIGARRKSPKAGEDLEDGYVTNNGKFVNRDKAYELAVAAKQYKPTDEDYNVNRELYGLTSERFNKQNPAAATRGNYAPPIPGKKKGGRAGRYSPAAPESLTSAAVRVDHDDVFTSDAHSAAYAKARKAGLITEDDQGGPRTEEGFMTSAGRFVNRQDGYNLAKQANQLHTQEPALTDNGRWLDSSNVRAFSPAEKRTPDESIRKQAADYAKEQGMSHSAFTGYEPLNEDLSKRVADAYEAAPHIPDDPKVQASYQALAKETKAQWDFLTKQGVKFEPWTKEGQPYKSSTEMRADVQQNKHLYYFPTEGGFGEAETPPQLHIVKKGNDSFEAYTADSPGAAPILLNRKEAKRLFGELEKIGGTDKLLPAPKSNNPMLAPTGDPKAPVVNDMFRAVHDYFGHAKEGYEFGPRGEYNAYLAHSRMFSKEAHPALTAETMGQNSWVNFGKHLRNEAGNVAKKGEPGFVKPTERPYAEQKATALPDELMHESMAPAETMHYPMEMTPGKAGGKLPGLLSAPYPVRAAYQEDMLKAMKPLFDTFGATPGKTQQSSYVNSAGVTEHNPMTSVDVPVKDAKLFGLLHGHFADQESVAGGYKETTPGNWEPASPHAFSESGIEGTPFADKIKAMGPKASGILAKLDAEVGPKVREVNSKWEEELNGSGPFDNGDYEPTLYGDNKSFSPAEPAQLSPAAEHPKTLTRQEMAKWLLDQKAHDSVGPLDAKAARWIASHGKSWKLTTLPTDLFDYSLDDKSHAAPGQPVVARYDKTEGWEALDGQHRISEAIRNGTEKVPAYVPVEHMGYSFSPSAFGYPPESDLKRASRTVKEVPEDAKPGQPIALGTFSPPQMSDKAFEKLAGKKMLFVIGDQSNAGPWYKTEGGKDAVRMQGGPGYPNMPDTQGKAGWAFASKHLATRLAKAFKNVDYMAVFVGSPDMIAGAPSFSKAYLAELHEAIASGQVKTGALNRLAREAGRYARGRVKHSAKIPVIHNFAELEHLLSTPHDRWNENPRNRGLSFEARAVLINQLGRARNSKKFGTPAYRLVRDKYNDTGAFEQGQLAQIIKLHPDKPIGTAEEHDVPNYPDYPYVIPGTGLGQPSTKLMMADVLKPWAESGPAAKQGGGLDYKVRMHMPQTEINPAVFEKK